MSEISELTVYTSASDGWMYSQSNVSFLTARNKATALPVDESDGIGVGTNRDSTNWYVHRGYLFFDTSSLPDGAVIDAAVLSINIYNKGNLGGDFNIVIQNGQPTYPHDPLVAEDFLHTHYSGNGGSVNFSALVYGWNDITLDATGRGWINKTGTTKLCLRSSRDINGQDMSVGTASSIYFYALEKGLAYRAKLVITYYICTVTTYAPTDIIRADPTNVTANASIEVPLDITTRGFKYGLTSTGDTDESETGTFSEGAFSLQITGLDEDTTHYIRAYAIGAWGTRYGSYVEFRTAYPYGSFKTEIETEKTASSGDIAAVGGKRSLTIENHLIQNQTLADLIANNYLAEYKDQKTKLVVTRPTPAPYEIGDTITRGSLLFYYAAVSALISYAPAASAEHYYSWPDRDMLIRKLNISFSAGNYVSVIELESS